jgi:thioester reductase-like protein
VDLLQPAAALVNLVRAEAARVLGHRTPDALGAADSFTNAGITSLAAAELADRLSHATGLRLPASAVFDHPAPERLAEHLRSQLSGDAAEQPAGLDLTTEVVLADDIRPSEPVTRVATDPETVLLTGATGFLGAFLLRDLLRMTNATVCCLVRAADEETARRRLRANTAWYGLSDEVDEARVTIMPGDLSRTRLGMSEEDYDRLARTVDAVYHAGSTVNWLHPYAELRDANVGGTEEILRLAARHRSVPVHHVSSTGVVAHRATPGEPVRTGDPSGAPDELPTGYQQSKWVAEGLVRLAAERGLPVSVYRPDVVCGDQSTGACQTDDFVWLSLKGCIQAGAVPEDAAARFALAPVDYVSGALVSLSLSPAAAGGVFHLYNPHSLSLETILTYLRRLGYVLDELPRAKWAELVRSDRRNAALPLLDAFLDVTAGRRVRPEFDVSDTRRLLTGSGIDCPEITEEIFGILIGFFVDSGYFPAPAAEIGQLHDQSHRRPR